MNEKIVIIGNGFDLRHFLPTKYNHLITILREIEQLNENCTSVSFSDLFSKAFKDKEEWFYNNICEYYYTNNIVFRVNDIKSIQERLLNNKWYQYLKTVEDSHIETWIDFETEINRVLEIILGYFEAYNNKKFKSNLGKSQYRSEKLFLIDIFFSNSYFINDLQRNILLNFCLFKKLDKQFICVNNDFILELNNNIQYYKEKYFFDSIHQELEEFIGIFNDYIAYIIEPFYKNFIEEKKCNFLYKDNAFLFNNVNRILSFNYTNTYNNLYKHDDAFKNLLSMEYGRLPTHEFIHGISIANWNDIKDLKMVLGVSDITDYLKKHKLFQFTKYFQKLHKDTDYLFLDNMIKEIDKVKNTKMLIENKFYFWGHSLDISDKDYIKDIFTVVEKTESIICVFYHSISGKADQLKNLLNIINKDTIESLMKDRRLKFIESTFENLYAELAQ
ncbi:AbiH family protein [Elizabethkingia anophelis]|uniref:AbiH family protein n=1 Tax=Elizabethkingia anophelis TaxID=1117645 RepID=UPI001623DF08|nr:AbiH family protein [Elizabethkingia anophelis]UKY86180.1 bacteriophage abortive infection AbiH family protein [Elizabethkingia anophelis]UKZ00293.1 bacteriophage abortive infection AbiH family protein [Elizabethkingia anophelis]HAY3542460.1 hypothetical protein [Elizabethkingia anophelis]